MNEWLQANQKLWDAWTGINARSEAYDLEGFRAGKGSLSSLEMEELGDVAGKSLLHLQCHFGKDTLSWARLGAEVTGADFSEDAISLARQLSEDLGIPARFVCSNLYDLPGVLSGQFDIVFTSYGVLGWLPDIEGWAEIVAHFLTPGGVFYIAEIHPFSQVFENTSEDRELRLAQPYFHTEQPIRFESQGNYADPDSDFQGVEYYWPHGLGSIVTALIRAGLRIEFLHEFPYTLHNTQHAGMEQGEDGYWRVGGQKSDIPLLFSIRATKTKKEY